MFIFDQLKRGERQLQYLALTVLIGMAILIGGLWWVQIVSAKRYEASQRKQMLRSVRVPALRGKILDRNGNALADNRPQYNIDVYLEEIRTQYWFQYTNHVRREYLTANPTLKNPPMAARTGLYRQAWYRAVSNITYRVSETLLEPRVLQTNAFLRHYTNYPYVPFAIFQNLTPRQIAIFSEKLSTLPGLELNVKSVRTYPYTNSAAHLLGYVSETKRINDNEDFNFNYYMPDYVGQLGTESAFDSKLRGVAGVKTVLVNSTQYRQHDEMSVSTEPGQNVWLTIDLPLQQAVEKALASAMPYVTVRGAAIVMDVRNGDILALASNPTFDPNIFVAGGISSNLWAKLDDKHFKPLFNRATFGGFTPGSIMKIITAIACLESNIDPREKVTNPGYWQAKDGTRIKDTAAPDDYDFVRAFKRSSNTYFIHFGLQVGLQKIVEVGKRFHLGEKTFLPTRQEVAGDFLRFDNPGKHWNQGTIANVSIGQEMTVTPLQMACMTAAVANGGTLYWPRIVSHTELAAGLTGETKIYQAGRVRENVRLHPQHLEILKQAMLADVEIVNGEEGTGHPAYLPHFRIAGKTGTAEVEIGNGQMDQNTWFVSFGPYENPRYAVVVLVESGTSGGKTCAPVAKKIYEVIAQREAGATRLQLTQAN